MTRVSAVTKLWQPMASVAVALGVMLAASPAVACRCARVDDAAHVAATPIIFTGRVMAGPPEVDGRALVFSFEVSETWKGDLPAVVAVRTPRSSATCGVAFEQGRTYTVFATPYRQDVFETGSCQLAPLQSRPELLKARMAEYRARVAAWDQFGSAESDGSKVLRRKLEFLLASNDWTAAVTTLEALLTRPQQDRAALLAQRGLLNYRLVRLDAARADFMAVLRLDPESPLAGRGLIALDRLDDIAVPARPDVQRLWPESFESPERP